MRPPMAQSCLLKVGNGAVLGPTFGPVVAEHLELVLNTFVLLKHLLPVPR